VVKNNKDGSTNFVDFDEIVNAHNVSKFIIGLPFDKDVSSSTLDFFKLPWSLIKLSATSKM
jgi:RNase H-fold protein (predicted Holliday junction resolvase)